MSAAPRRPIGLLAAGAVAWLAGALALLGAADGLARGLWYTPEALAAVHLIALGFVTVAIAGALLHLAPAMSSAPLGGGVWPGALVGTGGAALALGLWRSWAPAEAAGGTLLLVGGAWLLVGVVRLWRGRRGTWPEPMAGTLAAAAWLALVLAAGLLMLAERRHPFLGVDRTDLIAAHAVAGSLGWIGGMIVAVATRLAPVMLIARVERTWAARLALAAWHPGVALVVAGILAERRAVAVAGVAALMLALAAFGVHVGDAVRRRRRWPGPPASHLAIGIPALLAAGAIVMATSDARSLSAALALVLVGFGAGVTAGHVLLMLPTMCWTVRFGGLRRAGAAPPVAHLAPPLVGRIEGALFAGGVALLAGGIAAGSPVTARVGASLLAASAAALVLAVAVAVLRPAPGGRATGALRRQVLARSNGARTP